MQEHWDIYDSNRVYQERTHPRSASLPTGDFHVVVHVWITNQKGEYLISKRAPGKSYEGLWECTGGAVLAGESSLEGALREAKEELGVALLPENGMLIHTAMRQDSFADVWLFCQDIELASIALCPGETTGARWATADEIRAMQADGSFVPAFEYAEDHLFTMDKPLAFFPETALGAFEFAVIMPRYEGKWLFVRHRKRQTYEIPGGHIDPGETPEQAAGRELNEETGALAFTLTSLGPYGVTRGQGASYGVLFLAEVTKLGDLPEDFEMGERILVDDLPEQLTYPTIQPKLFAKATAYCKEHS